MKVECPSCTQHLAVDDVFAGQIINCPSCNEAITLPGAASEPPSPPIPPPIPSAGRPLAVQPQTTPPLGGSPVPAPLRSKAADAVAYAILLVPALLVWKAIGGLAGLFVAALIIFLFRGAMAVLLQSFGGKFIGTKGGGAVAETISHETLKELIPTAVAVLVLVILVLSMWKPWRASEHFTYTKVIRGKGCTVTVLDAKGTPVLEELVIFIDERARHSMKKDIPGKGRLEVYFGGFELTGVYFKGEQLKEKGSAQYSYSSQVAGTNATLIIHDADGKVVRTVLAAGVAAPPGPANAVTRVFKQSETNSLLTVTRAGRGNLQEQVKRPTITGHLEDVLLLEADFENGTPVRVTYQGKPVKAKH